MLKKILILFVVILAIPFITALFVKQDYSVVATVAIDRPVSEVFSYVKQLKNQDNFSVWARIDPDMSKSYRGTDGNVGFVAAWASDNEEVGRGEQEIIAIIDGRRIDYELRFLAPFEATSPAYMTTEAIAEQQTQVNWGFSGHMDYPMNLMFLFIDFETMIRNDLQQGLNTLKSVLEKE